MNAPVSYVLWAVLGAFVGGTIAWLVFPQIFWAALIGGAMTFAALRVGYVLLTSIAVDADDG